jgi:hypothetical protein
MVAELGAGVSVARGERDCAPHIGITKILNDERGASLNGKDDVVPEWHHVDDALIALVDGSNARYST